MWRFQEEAAGHESVDDVSWCSNDQSWSIQSIGAFGGVLLNETNSPRCSLGGDAETNLVSHTKRKWYKSIFWEGAAGQRA